MFAYCLNNPVVFYDDGGHKPKCLEETIDDPEDDGFFPDHFDGTSGNVATSQPGSSHSSVVSQEADNPSVGHVTSAYDSGYLIPDGGGGITDSISVGDTMITFGHGGRHLSGTGLTTNQVNQSIANDVITRELSFAKVTKYSVFVDGNEILYSAIRIASDIINIGTYFIKK